MPVSSFNLFMPRILITGEDSFIGKNFIRYSKFRDIKEVSLITNTPEEIDFSSYDVLLHLVAIVHQSQRIDDSEYFKINRDLCISVAEQAKKAGIKQFIFLSTIKVYGQFSSGSDPWNEFSYCNPDDAYGRSKYEAELALRKLESENFIVSIIRTPLVYGKGVRANMKNIIKLVDKFTVLPFGRVKNKRNFTYVENLVELIDRIIELKASGVFIAMDDEPLSTTELVKLISSALDKKTILIPVPLFIINAGKAIMPRIFDRLYGSFMLDNSHTKNTLGYKPLITAREGITRTVKQVAG